jgi:hypothetical protein
MKPTHLFLCCTVLLGLALATTRSFAEVLPVEFHPGGSAPTMTFLWRSSRAKATLIMIPGGEGHLGLTLGKADLGGFYGKTLKPLSNPELTSGSFNVVVFDSPTTLAVGDAYPISRTVPDHLQRIEDVVGFYGALLGKPIWLMGHSNGAVSITEFYKHLLKNQKGNLVSGMIFSSGRNGARFPPDTDVPVLFLAHESDRCQKSTNASSREAYNQLMQTSRQKTRYVLITSGNAESSDPCRSGYHMFFNAQEEAYKAIDEFVSDVLK